MKTIECDDCGFTEKDTTTPIKCGNCGLTAFVESKWHTCSNCGVTLETRKFKNWDKFNMYGCLPCPKCGSEFRAMYDSDRVDI